MNKATTKQALKELATRAVEYEEAFNEARVNCEHHAQNNLTKDHNCFEGNTKTECNHQLCPLKNL